jgi:adenylate cyclase
MIFGLGSGGILVVWTLLLCGYVIHRWRRREAQVKELSEFLKKMFGRYLSEEVMKTLIEKPGAVMLGGEKRKVTMMMTDLRGFTPLSERMDPQQVMALLNRYFNVMMKICKKYHGTINDIFGDALLVTFGAPQKTESHARAAVACAIEMQNAMESVNEENFRKALPELDMGIGLNTAEVVVGNIGSEDRAKFGVVGSGVNMASRIESYTVGGQILISESVYKEAGNILRIDAQREVFPKGTETPLMIYQVGCIAGHYNLALEEKDHATVQLIRRIHLQYKMLEGKDIGNQGLKGFMVRLSKKSAEIILAAPVDVLTNLKMNLTDVEEDLISKDFYGKVIERPDKNRAGHVIRFTAVPPEVGSYFQANRQYAAGAPGSACP